MKKALVMTLAILVLFGSLAFASGGKEQGDVGKGATENIQTPGPGTDWMPWPGIDWYED